MVNQKLIYHAVVFEESCQAIAGSVNGLSASEHPTDWFDQYGHRLLAFDFQPDHMHLLLEQSGEMSVQQVMSSWLNEIEEALRRSGLGLPRLNYALFSVSFSAVDRLIRFIEDQTEHHQLVSFDEELTSLLDKHDVREWAFAGPY